MPGKIQEIAIDGGKKLKLKKWSMMKCMTCLKEIGEISESIGDRLNVSENMTNSQLVQLIISLGEGAITKATKMIHESIHEPSLDEKDILEWDPDDFLAVGSKIIEMNFTDSLLKNFSGLKSAITNRLPQGLVVPQTPAQ
jgi:hypothetical protein